MRYHLQPIGRQLAFIVDSATSSVVWFSAAQSYWAVDAAHVKLDALNMRA